MIFSDHGKTPVKVSCMFRGCITYDGIGVIVPGDGNLNSTKYIENRDDLVHCSSNVKNLEWTFTNLHQKFVCLDSPQTTTGYNSERLCNKILKEKCE